MPVAQGSPRGRELRANSAAFERLRLFSRVPAFMLPVLQLLEHVPLAPRTTLGVGGRVRYLVEANSETDVVQALTWAAERGVAVRVLGGGSNLVVADAGFD